MPSDGVGWYAEEKKKKKTSQMGRGRAEEDWSRGGARQTGWSVRHPGAPQGGRCSHAVVRMRTERTRSR